MKARNILAFCAMAMLLAAALWWFLAPRGSHQLLISDATAAPIDGRPGEVAVFLKISNNGGPDRLVSVRSESAKAAALSTQGGLPIPASSTPGLAADGAFLRLSGVSGALDDGRTLPVTLVFERAGELSTRARIVAPRSQGAAADFGLFGIGDICVVGDGEPAPRIELLVTKDGDGWQVSVMSDEFSFTPDLVDGPHVPGTGHGHLYLDGMKLQRLYEPSARIGALPRGTHEVRVTLNTNDHRAYVIDDKPVTATAEITVE